MSELSEHNSVVFRASIGLYIKAAIKKAIKEAELRPEPYCFLIFNNKTLTIKEKRVRSLNEILYDYRNR